MEEAKFLGIAASQIPLIGLIVAVAGVIIAVLAFVAVQINSRLSALQSDITALRSEMNNNDNALRAEMNDGDSALRSEFRADFRSLEDRIERRADAQNAQLVGIKIDLAQIKGRLGIAEDAADASANAE